jgi:predicted RNA-binding Zn ribbon-like protein
MVEAEISESTFKFIGGWLCLDFTNTTNYGNADRPNDRLKSYADLVLWSHLAGELTGEAAQHLRQEAERCPAEAAAALQQAKTLRAVLYRIFSAIAAGDRPAQVDLADLNTRLAEMLGQSKLVPAGDSFAWAWTGAEVALDRLSWPVAWSAIELLTSNKLNRVGECGGDDCGWLFLDTSRNHSRRWCDMEDCGNRAKARRHYKRMRLVKIP